MTIIKKYFDKKPTDKQLYEFIAELIISNKGNYKTEVIYDKKNTLNICNLIFLMKDCNNYIVGVLSALGLNLQIPKKKNKVIQH